MTETAKQSSAGETKEEKFHRLADARLPKIIHALGLLENLGGSGYESNRADRIAIIDKLDDAVDGVAKAFGIDPPSGGSLTENEPIQNTPTQVPAAVNLEEEEDTSGSAPDQIPLKRAVRGGALAIHELQWAYDAVRRKDWKLAENRLKRILEEANG